MYDPAQLSSDHEAGVSLTGEAMKMLTCWVPLASLVVDEGQQDAKEDDGPHHHTVVDDLRHQEAHPDEPAGKVPDLSMLCNLDSESQRRWQLRSDAAAEDPNTLQQPRQSTARAGSIRSMSCITKPTASAIITDSLSKKA